MESREVGRLREEAEHPGEAALQGLLTCRLHISELQSSLISLCWVTEALPFSLCACLCVRYLCIPVRVCSCMHVRILEYAHVHVPACKYMCICVCNRAGNSRKCEALMGRDSLPLSPSLSLFLSRTAARNTHQTATRISQKPSDTAAAAAVESGPPVNTQT